MPLCLPSGEIQYTMFYITLLDVSCLVVLGHSWLTHYNLLIDWVLGSITFQPPKETESLVLPELVTPVSLTLKPPSSAPNIALVDAVVFTWAAKLTFKSSSYSSWLQLQQTPILLWSTWGTSFLSTTNLGMFLIKLVLTPCLLINHMIWRLNLKKELFLHLVQSICYLHTNSLQTLHKFIDKHLAYSFIHPMCSPCGAPILFIKKKDGSLQLCVNFQGFNRFMKKDCYTLPHISDLLDSPQKALPKLISSTLTVLSRFRKVMSGKLLCAMASVCRTNIDPRGIIVFWNQKGWDKSRYG